MIQKRGFTLLETLVAMVIASLVSVVLVQSLSQILQLRERILFHTQYQREHALRHGWFADTVGALAADLPGIERHRFTGRPDGFEGLTFSALQDLSGVPKVIKWRVARIEAAWHLYYSEEGSDMQLAWAWLADEARFEYYDPQTGWVPEWPPRSLDVAPLPAAVSFITQWQGRPVTWVAAVRSQRVPRSALEPLPGI